MCDTTVSFSNIIIYFNIYKAIVAEKQPVTPVTLPYLNNRSTDCEYITIFMKASKVA